MLTALTVNVQVALAGVIALLATTSVALAGLGRVAAGGTMADLRLRVRSWWVMVAVLGLAVLLGRAVSLLFVALISFLALKEYLSMIPTRRADREILLLAYAAIPIQYALIAGGRLDAFAVLVPLYALIVMPSAMVLTGATRGFLGAAALLGFGLMVTVYAPGHLAALLVLPAAANPSGGAIGLAFYLVFLSQFNDVVQYLAGKALGRRKLIPRISPNKTWEGLLAGLGVTVVLAALLAPWLTPLAPGEAIAAGLLIGLGGVAGDVMLSAIKRDLGVKDTGALIPGHGGILDRIDSLVFTAPLFFYLVG